MQVFIEIRLYAVLVLKQSRADMLGLDGIGQVLAPLLVDAHLVLRVRREPIVRDVKVVVVLLEFLNSQVGFYLKNESLSKSLSDFT